MRQLEVFVIYVFGQEMTEVIGKKITFGISPKYYSVLHCGVGI